MKFAFYCKCGAGWTGYVPEKEIERLKKIWDEVHNDPGCAPAKREEALRARAKAEAEAEAEIEREMR